MNKMGAVFAEARKRAGYTQEELAEILGCGREYVSRIETDARTPSWRFISAFASATGANLIDLLRASGLIDGAGVRIEQEIAAILRENPELAVAFDYIRDYPHRIPEILKYIRFLKGEEEEEETIPVRERRRVQPDQAASR